MGATAVQWQRMFFIPACCVHANVCFCLVTLTEMIREWESESKVSVILPSFLLKSLQFISLLCQGGLQVQVASIVGQLEGTVIRLDQKKTKLNTDQHLRCSKITLSASHVKNAAHWASIEYQVQLLSDPSRTYARNHINHNHRKKGNTGGLF